MDQVVSGIIERVLAYLREHMKTVEQYIDYMEAVLERIAESPVVTICPFCGNGLKDLSWIIEKDPMIRYWNEWLDFSISRNTC